MEDQCSEPKCWAIDCGVNCVHRIRVNKATINIKPLSANEAFNGRKTKTAKYRNIKVEIDGIKFDSKKEANYYGKLKLLKQSGEIDFFLMQPKYDLIINGVKCGFYKADFIVHWKSGLIQVIDVKGMKTPIYQLKKKLVKAIYGIIIHEV